MKRKPGGPLGQFVLGNHLIQEPRLDRAFRVVDFSVHNRAVEMSRRQTMAGNFDTGMVRINSFGAADPSMPFGGVKDSGYGREHGGFGMKEFVNAKAIFLPS